MRFGREINRLLIGMLAAFGVIGFAAAYWSMTGADTILTRADNPRRVEAEAAIRRGAIYDADGALLAESVLEDGVLIRRYPERAVYSALGYFSQRYGASGIEAAYDAILRGDERAGERDRWAALTDMLLHRPQVGADVRLTLDLGVQTALAAAFTDQRGGAVVLGASDGRMLGILSAPAFDPNTLETNWETLRADPGRPFFNRALQARYQPGAAAYSLLMAGALLTRQPLDAPLEDATAPIPLGTLTLTCAVPPPESARTLRDAYAFACPKPFTDIIDQLGSAGVQGLLDTFRVGALPTLPGFVAAPPTTPPPLSAPFDTIMPNSLLAEGLGQGTWSLTLLDMALIAAGILNDGNVPQPYLLAQTRAPNSETWVHVNSVRPTLPIATVSTALSLQDLMRGAAEYGAAYPAARTNLDIGGHVGLAYTGEQTLAWFVGFVTVDLERAAVAVVVLENSRDLGLAADIGGTALEAAWNALQTPSAAFPQTGTQP